MISGSSSRVSRRFPAAKWLVWTFVALVVVPGVPFVLGTLALVAYMYWPGDFDEMTMPEPAPNASHSVVLVHGLRDTRATWSDPVKQALDAREQSAQVISLDWSPYSGDMFRCSVDGWRIGQQVGRRLAESSALESVHLVGHSCGSFVVLGICEALREQRPGVAIHTTFLDPVTVYGGFFWDYGLEHFGRCGDFSEAYIDTEDDVPGSNQVLPNAHTFDVTEARKHAAFSGSPHVWPTVYYLGLARAGKLLDLRSDAALATRYPKGVLQKISE